MYGIIYKITNIITGLIYIGQTIAPLDRRWREHKGDARTRTTCRLLHAAIRQYGEESFTVEEIDRSDTREGLAEKEIAWIAHYDATNPDKGYNCTTGGTACVHGPSSKARQKGRKWTEEAKAKRVATMRERDGWKHTPERREHLRQARLGIKFSSEWCANLSAARRNEAAKLSPEERKRRSEMMIAAANRKRAENGGVLPASSEAMKRVWARRKAEGDPEFFAKRAEATRAYWQQPEVRAREAAKWTPEMKEKNRVDHLKFLQSFKGVLAMAKRKRNWRAKKGVAMKPVRLLMGGC